MAVCSFGRPNTPLHVIVKWFINRKNPIALRLFPHIDDLFYGKDFRKKLPFLELFDVIHDATYTETLKPDPRAYRACIEALGLAAHDCVFVDDQARNITGAEAVGMQTVHFDVSRPGVGFFRALERLHIKEDTP